ncbi:hypothetical protein SRHO_G00193600 [Serrasalmus rhombeus]
MCICLYSAVIHAVPLFSWRSLLMPAFKKLTLSAPESQGSSRVLPLKAITVPRLELAASALLVKVDKMLRRELHLHLKASVFWTDRQMVLKYIANDSVRFKTYVANRVSLIRDNTHLSQWRYVSSKVNPADDCSRGLSARKLTEQRRWIHAPDFFWRSKERWPVIEAVCSVFQDDPEVRKNTAVFATMVETETPTDQLILYFSDWMRLLKAVAWYIRLKGALMLKMKGGKELLSPLITHSNKKKEGIKSEDFRTATGGHLSMNDIAEAEWAIIAYVQCQAFPAVDHWS